MSKKKRFGISDALTRGLSETISVVENNSGVFRNVILPLSRIELDPDNPRKLTINIQDVKDGLRPDDPLYQKKSAELENLKELAHTISTSGVINPIVVYKLGETYRVVAGERRCLASLLAGKQEVEARIFHEKPKGFELKLIQWIENTAREGLTLEERLGNVRDILKEYQSQNGNVEITATLLKSITGLSLSQSAFYIAALKAPEDVQKAIQLGSIRNLDKAALIAGVNEKNLRAEMLIACENGSSIKELRSMINQHKQNHKLAALPSKNLGGPVPKKINMGATTHSSVVQAIVSCVISHEKYDKFLSHFESIDWGDLTQATKAFRKLVHILENEKVVA